MPVTYANNHGIAYYGISGSGGSLPCAYDSANVAGNIGMAWLTANEGAGPSGLTDTYSNVWYPFAGYFTNFGYSTIWVCPSLIGGANTVTVRGVIGGPSPSNAPVLSVMEYQPPSSGSVGFQALRGALGVNGIEGWDVYPPVLELDSVFSSSAVPYYSTLVAFLATTPSDSTNTVRTWSSTANLRFQYTDAGSKQTGAVADATSYNTPANSVVFSYSPTTPPLVGGYVSIVGILMNTTA